LPASRFNQYNVPVLRPPSHSLPTGFAQLIARKFGRGPFLAIGSERDELEQQFESAGVRATIFASITELTATLSKNGSRPRADLAVWFYPPDQAQDEGAAEALATFAENVLLVPEAGAEISKRRPHLVECFGRAGLLPDYDCDLGDLEPGGLRLVRSLANRPKRSCPRSSQLLPGLTDTCADWSEACARGCRSSMPPIVTFRSWRKSCSS
jgi:hypothetical protein